MNFWRLFTTLCVFTVLSGALFAREQRLSHKQSVAAVACIHQAAEKDFGGEEPRPFRDHAYHMRYSIFRDSDEGFPGWHLVYLLGYEPDGAKGWIYKLYVHRHKAMVEIGEYGTVKRNRQGRMEIDDVWGGLGTHDLITRRLKLVESTPLLRISSQEVEHSALSCYDSKHPSPE